jgi:hypothetical protein
MADNTDFFKQPEEPKEEAQAEKVKIGEREFDQTELDRLVKLGEKATEVEKTYGSMDKFVAESGRRANEIGKYKQQLEELQSKIQQSQQGSGELSPEQVDLAKRQLNNLIGGEPITDKNFAKLYVAMREGEKLIDECSDLSKEIDGSDGRPKFDKDEIINYMSETGIKKPLAAYRDKFEEQLKTWETGQLAGARPKSIFTQGAGSGEKQPSEVRPRTTDDLAKMLTESIYGPQE